MQEYNLKNMQSTNAQKVLGVRASKLIIIR